MEEKRLLCLKDLARIFGMSYRTMKRWKATGKLPPPSPIGLGGKWTRESIERWERERGPIGANRGHSSN